MLLFDLYDGRTEKGLYKYASSVWQKFVGAALWVNGRWNMNERRWNTVPFEKPLSDDITWYTGFDDDYTNNCLRTSNIRGDFSVDGYDCETKMNVFCEYDCRLLNNYFCRNITRIKTTVKSISDFTC